MPPDDFPPPELRATSRYASFGLVGWLFFVSLGVAGAAFMLLMYVPLRGEHAEASAGFEEARARAEELAKGLEEAELKVSDLTRQQTDMSSKLAATVAEKEQLEKELKEVQAELSSKLEVEIQSGNIELRRRGSELVVDVADKVLFATAEADVTESGKSVLTQVAQSLAPLKGYAIQVGGHTDSARVISKETRARFPTNWELSTARATNVVRFLQERGKIPGERLVASGFAQFRPAASNKTEEGRQKNRRIEIVLLPVTKN